MIDPIELTPLIRRWGRIWGVPDLADGVSLQFSARMRRSLGRCRPTTGQVTLAIHLRDAPRELLEEVLCHEVAHVAVHQLLGPRAKPHSASWRELVVSAGFVPRTRAPAFPATDPPGRAVSATWYHHRCPVCQALRVARRPVPSWHCAECLEAGLPGTMVISREPPTKTRDE